MKNLLFTATFLATAFISKATELSYKWRANTAYTFSSLVTDNIQTSMMGMNVQDKYTTTIDFVMAIQSVDAEGTASGRLYLINYTVKNGKGATVASILNVPKNAIQSEIKVDNKGNFTFLKTVTLVTTPTSNALVYGNASENGVQAGGVVGDEKVDVYAEFDPKTGKLKAGYSVQTVKTPKKVDVKENEESDFLDVFPYDLLEFLLLPEGDVKANDQMEVTAGMYTVNENIKSLTAKQAVIGEQISTNKNNDMFQGSANGSFNDGQEQIQMQGMGGESEMELDAEDQAAMGSMKAMAPDMSGNLTTTFDIVNGMFLNSKGTITTNIDMMGAKMTVVTNFDLKKKP